MRNVYDFPSGMLTFDNDPRLVGCPAGRNFPSALVRFLWCVEVCKRFIETKQHRKIQ